MYVRRATRNVRSSRSIRVRSRVSRVRVRRPLQTRTVRRRRRTTVRYRR